MTTVPVPPVPPVPPDPRDADWWRSAVIYQIYVRSFADGDGDGLGDLAGISARLPYVADLGVDAVWINPWYPSPMLDGGYDVADYREVDPALGTVAQAEELLVRAHELGLRVLLDIVPNHTSWEHVWFREALAAPAGSPARARYLFRDGRGPDSAEPPTDWSSTFGGPAWTRVTEPGGTPGQWYLHLFDDSQPDLDWTNPEVRAEFLDVLAFWFDRGVDGFRIDVAHSLVKDQSFPDLGTVPGALLGSSDREDHPHWDRPEVHEIFTGWRELADSYDPPRVFVAEAWVSSQERLGEYVREGRLHTAFNFDFLRAPWDAAALRRTVAESVAGHAESGAPTTWVLGNHDVTRPVTRYGLPQPTGAGEAHLHAQGGAVDVTLGRRRARAAVLLELALPGGAYVYQGEELGLEEVLDLPAAVRQDPVFRRTDGADIGRDGCRVPMPWEADGPSLGFGSAPPWLPQPPAWSARSVAAQDGDPGSTLELYRTALLLRRALPGLGDGPMEWVELGPDALGVARGQGFLCVVNLGAEPLELPAGEVLLASAQLVQGALPTDTAVWLSTGAPA